MKRGPAMVSATLQTQSTDPSLAPFRIRLQIEGTELCESIAPWGTKVTVTSPIMDIRLPERYAITIAVEPMAGWGLRRPDVSYRLSGIGISAR